MDRNSYKLGNCSFEILSDADRFLGIGKILIGDTLVRSGRLPWRFDFSTFTGLDLSEIRLLSVEATDAELRVRTRVEFAPSRVKAMRDHSFDPIHDTTDWADDAPAGEGMMDMVFTPSADQFGGEAFAGFAFRYEYKSENVPLYWIYDKSSWEIDGDIEGAGVISQSSCSAPVAHFGKDTGWTTEGVIHFDDGGHQSKENPVMTHNLPRWTGHQAFDFQFKGDKTLVGVFERVDLIRSLLLREPGKPELKTFDKYIFDQALHHRTPAKKILLNATPRTFTGQKNLWTWMLDEIHNRARAEYGIREEPLIPKVRNEYWRNWTYERKATDAAVAAANLGFEGLFSHDNLLKSAWSEGYHWNVCCCHEYEPIDNLGGAAALKELVDACREKGLRLWGWTNNDQSLSSPLNRTEREDGSGRYVLLEDARQKYGGAYAGCMSVLDLNNAEMFDYWLNSHNKVKDYTGLSCWWFDSFYNLAFMPINYRGCRPHTMWRNLLRLFAEMQQAGHTLMIETFGPFGEPSCGAHSTYGEAANLFACYKMTVNPGYTVIPSGTEETRFSEAESIYRFFAHMASPQFNLYQDGKRIDEIWSDAARRALADYTANRRHMHKRYLQEDGLGVVWHDADETRATFWNFAGRAARLPGEVVDATTGKKLTQAEQYDLRACHTYVIRADELPVAVE